MMNTLRYYLKNNNKKHTAVFRYQDNNRTHVKEFVKKLSERLIFKLTKKWPCDSDIIRQTTQHNINQTIRNN